MDRREFLRTCSIALVGAMLPKSVLGETKETVKRNLENILGMIENNESQTTEIFTKKISDMAGSPFEMKGVYAKNSLRQFLGINQYEAIFENYNKEVVQYRQNGKINDDKDVYLKNELKIPRVYDELRQYFPESLNDYITMNPEAGKDIGSSTSVILVGKAGNGKFTLAYYKDSELFLATHVSPGKVSKAKEKEKRDKITGEMKTIIIPGGFNSPEGTFNIPEDSHIKYKKSKKFELSPMPYAIQIYKGVFFHHGQDVDGYKKSHGCIRVPGFYQEEIYKNVSSGTKVIIMDTKS